jgi:predicted Zn-dependent peptidase
MPRSPFYSAPRAARRLAAAAPVLFLGLAVLTAAGPAAAQDLADFERRTTVHTLDNGWTFVIVERPVAPVFTFATYARVGSAQEVPGITGLAHMFEHMAFKGTDTIGTNDYAAEKTALAEMEAAYLAYQGARLAPRPDAEEVAHLEAAFEERQEAAGQYVVANEFDEIIERAGGVGMNAFTNADWTAYFYSLPANKTELFAYLESDRFANPVFREFYQERDVVQEERRLRTESNPLGKLVEQFLTVAFIAHPYGQPTVGYMSDLQAITITDARAFFDTYYAPANLVTAIVGDVDAEALVPMLDAYFGRIPARPAPPALRTVEPPQIAAKRVVVEDPAQPVYFEGYHRPALTHPDQAAYDAIDDILSNGRTSRLYRSLVRDRKIASQVASFSGFPGERYPTLWMVWAMPARGAGNAEIEAAVGEELARLTSEDVSDAELERFKTRTKATLLRSLRNNFGLADQLARHQALTGDWRDLFTYIDEVEAVTAANVRRVAKETFRPTNRTVAVIETTVAGAAAAPPAPGGESEETGAAEPAAGETQGR